MNGKKIRLFGKCSFTCVIFLMSSYKRQVDVPAVPETYKRYSSAAMQIHTPQDQSLHDHHKVHSSIQVAMDVVSNGGEFRSDTPTVVRVAVRPNVVLRLKLVLLLAQGMRVLDGKREQTFTLPGGRVSEFFYTLDVKEPGQVLGFSVQEVESKRPQFGQAVLRIGEKSKGVEASESLKKEIHISPH